MNDPPPELPTNPDFRVAKWNAYTPSGDRLAKRSMAMKWRWIHAAIFLSSLLVSVSIGFLIVTNFPVLRPLSAVICGGLMAGIAVPLLLRVRTQVLGLQLGDPSEERVFIRLEFDRFEYGRDHGRISFVDGWLYFEGERTSFSLAPSDVELAWYARSLHHAKRIELNLGNTIPGAVIVMDGITKIDPRLFKVLCSWQNSSGRVEGDSVFPPMQRSGSGGYSRMQDMRTSVGIGVAALMALLVEGDHLFGRDPGKLTGPVATVALLAGLVLPVLLHRAYVAFKRNQAFRRLDFMRDQFESKPADQIPTPGLVDVPVADVSGFGRGSLSNQPVNEELDQRT